MEQISGELEEIFQSLKDEQNLTDELFILTALKHNSSILYQYMKNNLLTDDFKGLCLYLEEPTTGKGKPAIEYMDDKVRACGKTGKIVTSLVVFAYILEEKKEIETYFKKLGVTRLGVMNANIKTSKGMTFSMKRGSMKNSYPVANELDNKVKTVPSNIGGNSKLTSIGDAEKNLVNINEKVSKMGTIPFYYGKGDIVDMIWNCCETKENRTIVIKGDFGKNNLIEYMAYLLNVGEVPYKLKNKVLLKVDLPILVNDIAIKGVFESKFRRIIKDAKVKGKYILIVDDTNDSINDESYRDYHFMDMVKELIDEESIPLIIFAKNANWLAESKYTEIDLDKYDGEELYDIAKRKIMQLEEYHNVKFDEQMSMRLFSKVGTDTNRFKLMLQFLDNLASYQKISKDNANDVIVEIGKLEDKLSKVLVEKDKLMDDSGSKSDDKIDELLKMESELKKDINLKKKGLLLKTDNIEITLDNGRSYIHHVVESPTIVTPAIYSEWEKILATDVDVKTSKDNYAKTNLKTLNGDIKKIVIGQEEAIDEICQVIKRQQLGFNLDKPSVVLCTGSTGVGKSYLCKTIANKVFGSENNMVCLDMSEYAEKNSVSKLYGTSAGYVGYENGGILTEAVKKIKKGILLLDEMEKAHSEVFDAFLQVFDEGRLTDNHGETVSFKDFIIVMTSNIGAEESTHNQGGIGFKKQSVDEYKKEVVEKAMKARFKPEFLNRIDKVIHFHSLDEDNLKTIIRLELDKFVANLKTIGYKVGDAPYDDGLVDYLFGLVKDDKEYGARPIIRIIKNEVENKVIQKIIDDDLDKGYAFEKIWIKD